MTGCLTLLGTGAVDLALLAAGMPLPPSQLHHLAVTAGGVLAAAGLVGQHVVRTVELGRRLERMRSSGSAVVVPLPTRGRRPAVRR